MKTVLLRCIMVVVLAAAIAGQASAQRRSGNRSTPSSGAPRLGPHLGYNFDANSGFIGAQAIFPLAPAFELYPSFDLYFLDAGTAWALNFDFRFRPRAQARLFYVGGGLNYLRQTDDGFGFSNTNLSFVTGIENRRQRVAPYAELRLTVGDGSSFQMAGGLSWRL